MKDGTKPTLETLDIRVSELEEWKGAMIGEMSKTSVSLRALTTVVGSYPDDDDKGSGMAADVAMLKETVGEEPSEMKGTPGSGMAKMVSEVHKLTMKRQGIWPGAVSAIKSMTTVLTFVVVSATVISGCAAGATYLIRIAVQNTSQIAHPAPTAKP